MPVRLVAIDIDGTLIDSRGRLPEANRDAIAAVVEAGVHVTLVTGRSFPFARDVAGALPASVTIIASNGAVERTRDGDAVAQRLLSCERAQAVLQQTWEYRTPALSFSTVSRMPMSLPSRWTGRIRSASATGVHASTSSPRPHRWKRR